MSYRTQPDGDGTPMRERIPTDPDAWEGTEQDPRTESLAYWREILAGADEDAKAASASAARSRASFLHALRIESAAIDNVLRLRRKVAQMEQKASNLKG